MPHAKSRILALSAAATMLLASACGGSDAPSSAEQALSELERKYEELRQSIGREDIEKPVDWAKEDLENIGDWEYRVEELPALAPGELTLTLDGYGDDRWEVFWLERRGEGYLVVMKRPSVSLLSRVPLSRLGRLLSGGSAAAE